MLSRTTIVVHGGAWKIPASLSAASLRGVEAAARAGGALLRGGGSALDAVERAVRSLEDDEAFDAGHGAVLNAAGRVELDAVIMEGSGLRAGGVAAIGAVANPVSVARLVMERTEHCLLVGEGATEFARANGVAILPDLELVTAAALAEFEEMQRFPTSVKTLFNHGLAHDTVGAVAIDEAGRVAAATSTGGISCKMVGRVGDSPLIGSGCFADDFAGAVSTTGHGESIMRLNIARQISLALEGGAPPDEACAAALANMRRRVGGCGGAICVDRTGRAAAAFTTERMAWAVERADGSAESGIDPGGAATDGVEVIRLS